MAGNEADGPAHNGTRGEHMELVEERWQRKLAEMTPEVRERFNASVSASLDKFRVAWVSNSGVKALVDSMHAEQRRLAQSVSERLVRTAQPSIPPMAGLSAQKILEGVDFSGFEKVTSQIAAWFKEQSGVREAMKGISEALLRWFPANLRNLPEGGLVQVSDIVRDEGIALYGAPRQEIVVELLAAPDLRARRGILGGRAAEISLDCRALLETCSSEASQLMTAFALEALDSFDAGHTASAQALAASIIDTLLQAFYGSERSRYTPSRPGAPNPTTVDALDSLPFREYLAVSPIWQVYQQFWAWQGDPIPETFNRHASAHAVSPEQYTLVNAVQSLLFASTLLWFIDQEIVRKEAAAANQGLRANNG